jgi:hypothetical protein
MPIVQRGRKQYYAFWLSTIDGPRRAYDYLGPADRPSVGNRALSLMARMEVAEETKHWIYELARRIVCRELFGINKP